METYLYDKYRGQKGIQESELGNAITGVLFCSRKRPRSKLVVLSVLTRRSRVISLVQKDEVHSEGRRPRTRLIERPLVDRLQTARPLELDLSDRVWSFQCDL